MFCHSIQYYVTSNCFSVVVLDALYQATVIRIDDKTIQTNKNNRNRDKIKRKNTEEERRQVNKSTVYKRNSHRKRGLLEIFAEIFIIYSCVVKDSWLAICWMELCRVRVCLIRMNRGSYSQYLLELHLHQRIGICKYFRAMHDDWDFSLTLHFFSLLPSSFTSTTLHRINAIKLHFTLETSKWLWNMNQMQFELEYIKAVSPNNSDNV